jgi:ubiquinone/menaquinone biosynthesis C-methylase UbiE
MDSKVSKQKDIHDALFSDAKKFDFHITKDLRTRYLRDRRLVFSLRRLSKHIGHDELLSYSVLVVCGGIGGEALFFKRYGFKDVTNSDLSTEAVRLAPQIMGDIKSIVANSESLPFDNESYDLVVVQDGLHHLPRPALGFTEMLRVSRKAVIVIEPRDSLVGNFIGTEFENIFGVENFVFRWNKSMFKNVVKSYLLKEVKVIEFNSLWDHSLAVLKLTKFFSNSSSFFIIKLIYNILSPFNKLGNIMVGLVLK